MHLICAAGYSSIIHLGTLNVLNGKCMDILTEKNVHNIHIILLLLSGMDWSKAGHKKTIIFILTIFLHSSYTQAYYIIASNQISIKIPDIYCFRLDYVSFC